MTKFEKSVVTFMFVIVVLYFTFSLVISPYIAKSQYQQVDIVADSATMKSLIKDLDKYIVKP